jgi:arylsulfatase A-like enzyme
MHVNLYNDDPARPGQGVPSNMTVLAAKLKARGYATHFLGKWHIGMASRSTMTPRARGFDTSLGYFHSTNSYYDSRRAEGCAGEEAVDLWQDDGPASHLNGTAYEERIFGTRAVQLIRAHGRTHPERPFFMYYAFHTSCVGWNASAAADPQNPDGPEVLQPDAEFYARFAHIDDQDRRANVAMVALMDEIVGNITSALQQAQMWPSTLLLWSSDNGGAVHLGGGANTWPLRGGYYNNWEGGIRVAALLNGGLLPPAVRGTQLHGFIHECDWYATFCALAGVDPFDHVAAAAGLPPIDSLNVWPLISGASHTSPRVEWPLTPLGEDATRAKHGGDAGYMAEGRYKLLVGVVRQAGWCGMVHPNTTTRWDSFGTVAMCNVTDEKVGYLFDVLEDPGEHHDLALQMPVLAAEEHWFNPDRGEPDPRACEVAKRTGFWQPFLP